MKRREFMAGVAVAAMLQKTVGAQQADAVRRVAMLVSGSVRLVLRLVIHRERLMSVFASDDVCS